MSDQLIEEQLSNNRHNNWRQLRRKELGFDAQKEISYNHYLPYGTNLDEECVSYLSQIKANIARTVVLNDRHGFSWISDLSKYLRLYGRLFSKEDHIYFINTLYQIVLIPGLELNRVTHFANVLSSLLRKSELISRDELTIAWRPLYKLHESTLYSQYEKLGMIFIPKNYVTAIKNLVRCCRVYFSAESTQEMLDEWRPLLCPYDTTMIKGVAYFELFLPTLLMPEEHCHGFKLWLEEFLSMWQSCQYSPLWEQKMISLFARLANDTIGYIDWTPHIPVIFTHLIGSFNLMGGSQKVRITRDYSVFYIDYVVLWLVAMLGPNSTCQQHVTQLFKAIESYYHPSNTGRWNLKLRQLLFKLPSSFVNRIHKERYKKPSWKPSIPDEYKLTDKNINEFVDSITNVVMISMFSRFGSAESASALQNLSLLRPEKVIPPVLEKMYASLDTLTEPHRLTASMQCVVSIARALVKGGKYYAEGPTHVIPLLLNSLNGLDVNDMKKCKVTFQFISKFATLLPIIDCSSAADSRDDLSEIEMQLCISTSQFEDFVLQFMDRCFVIIENSSLEHTNRVDQENHRMNTEEGIIEIGLASTFGSILLQSSPQIFESALDKLHSFVSSRIFETKVAGKFASILVRSCSKANAKLSLQKFLPHFCKLILALTESDEIINEELLDHELLFRLQIISEVVRCDGKYLLEYRELLVKVLEKTLNLTCRKGYLFSSTLLKHLLKSLTLLHALDFRSIAKPWEAYDNFKEHLPIKDWGCSGDLHNLNVKFHIPDEEELNFAQFLLQRFLKPELNRLIEWTNDLRTLSREQLQRSLQIILDCVTGSSSALPIWDGDNIKMYESLLPSNTCRVRDVGSSDIKFDDNENIRQTVMNTLRLTLEHMMQKSEDDSKSLCLLIKIYHNVMFFYGVTKQDFDTRWKRFQVLKKNLENKLTKNKQYIRARVVDRLLLQHEMRLMNKSITNFTEMHRFILKDLMTLATSHYSEVRARAQHTLFTCFRTFPYSYRVLLPDIIQNLSKDNDINHEQFKGTLFILLGRINGSSLLTARDWSTLIELWPALVNAQHSEKPSIIRLLDIKISGYVHKYFDTLTITLNVSDECVECAKKVWFENKSLPLPAFDCPSVDEVRNASIIAQKRNQTNIDLYNNLIEKLVELMEHSNLHWRYYQLSFVLLRMLIRYDIPLPKRAVDLFTKNLIHDTLYIRKIAISSFSAVLKQLKPVHQKVELKPIPNNNLWLQTDLNFDIMDEHSFNSAIFIDKPHIGFYCFAKPLFVYDRNNSTKRKTVDSFSDSERIIYTHFNDSDFLGKFLSFLSLEENKGKDKFSAKRFQLWKGLYRNYGPFNVGLMLPKITEYVSGTLESAHRCAAEIIAGILRGSKHWSYSEYIQLIDSLQPILKQVFSNITTETLWDWGTCSATIFKNRDPKRFIWILKMFLDDPLKDGGESISSFLQASRLYLLHSAVKEQEWRAQKLFAQILYYLEDKHLTHSYQNVRERIGSLLCNIFMYDVKIPALPSTYDNAPKLSPFIQKVLPRLEILCNGETESQRNDATNTAIAESKTFLNGFTPQSQERKDAENLLKTLCKWIIANVLRAANRAPPEIFKFLPILCLMQSYFIDEELVRESFLLIILLSQTQLTEESIEVAIETAKQVTLATNWHSRSAIATFLQYMVSSNLFILINNNLWVNAITELILRLLDDERVEVRESTAVTLSGLVHCEFIKVDHKLINYFKSRSNQKLSKRNGSNGGGNVDPKDIRLRHSGVLGLCACVNAFPYDVPNFMPDIIMFMSEHLNDPQPIPSTIKKTLSNFRRTHNDSWRDHKLKFTEDQLSVITDLLVSPSYYA